MRHCATLYQSALPHGHHSVDPPKKTTKSKVNNDFFSKCCTCPLMEQHSFSWRFFGCLIARVLSLVTSLNIKDALFFSSNSLPLHTQLAPSQNCALFSSPWSWQKRFQLCNNSVINQDCSKLYRENIGPLSFYYRPRCAQSVLCC